MQRRRQRRRGEGDEVVHGGALKGGAVQGACAIEEVGESDGDGAVVGETFDDPKAKRKARPKGNKASSSLSLSWWWWCVVMQAEGQLEEANY
jgi:hypothetical protein